LIHSTNHQEIVRGGLYDLLAEEFFCEVILAPAFDPARLTKGEYIRFWFVPSELVNNVYTGEYRTYNIEIYFYFDTHRKRMESILPDISDKVDRLKQLLIDNVSYAPGDFYKWHYLAAGSIEIDNIGNLEDVENAEDVMTAKIEIQITRGNF
jgi:hypothetical protein